MAQLAASPAPAAYQSCQSFACQSIREPRHPLPARCPCGCAHGPCRSMAAPARCPMRRTARAQPVGHGVRPDGPTVTRAGRAAAQGTKGPATSSPPQFPARPRGAGVYLPVPAYPARRTSPRHPSPGRPSDVEAVAGTAILDRRAPPASALPCYLRFDQTVGWRRRWTEVHGGAASRRVGCLLCRHGFAERGLSSAGR